jgi:hypothetical protein
MEPYSDPFYQRMAESGILTVREEKAVGWARGRVYRRRAGSDAPGRQLTDSGRGWWGSNVG